MSPLWKNIFRRDEEKSLTKFIKGIPIFSELNDRERHYLGEYLHVRHFNSGETVYTEEDIGTGLYMIRSGFVRLSVNTEKGDSIELARLEAGDFFGETAMSEAAPRLVTAVAVEASELVGFFRTDLLQIAQNRPGTGNKILLGLSQVLAHRIQTMETLHRDNLSTIYAKK